MESWMPFFVVVTALAVVLQAVILIMLFVQMRRTAAQVERTVNDLNGKLTPLISRVQFVVEDIAPRISGIVADAAEVTRLARSEAQKVDRILSEALERLRMQLIHVDHILTGAMEAVEEAGSRMRQTVWAPVAKATAVLRGVQAGIDFFRGARHRRGPLDRIDPSAEQQDEGMFI
jgi:type IV secretory pathway VirB2 component (pilin)